MATAFDTEVFTLLGIGVFVVAVRTASRVATAGIKGLWAEYVYSGIPHEQLFNLLQASADMNPQRLLNALCYGLSQLITSSRPPSSDDSRLSMDLNLAQRTPLEPGGMVWQTME